jgi:hypothetical protein
VGRIKNVMGIKGARWQALQGKGGNLAQRPQTEQPLTSAKQEQGGSGYF